MSRVLKIVVGGMLLAPSVFAQPASPPAPTPSPPAGETDIGVRARATLTPQEMLSQSREYRTRIQEIVARIQTQVNTATTEKDIIRVNCLTDKLVQARAHLAISEQSITTLEQAVGKGDEAATVHEYTRATIVSQKTQVLATEADQCIGEDLAYVGTTKVIVDVDPGINPGDPTQPDNNPSGPTRPETASPVE